LLLTSDDPPVHDPGAIRPVQEEKGKTEFKAHRGRSIDLPLPTPFANRELCSFNALSEPFILGYHGSPERYHRSIDIVQ
jgi:hypothetical protein